MARGGVVLRGISQRCTVRLVSSRCVRRWMDPVVIWRVCQSRWHLQKPSRSCQQASKPTGAKLEVPASASRVRARANARAR
eukprot:3645144-Lingulodinium_polyedra.AAC.1